MAHTRHGFLVVQYPQSGDKYEGEWVLGKKHGKGRYTSHNGDMYEGEYKDGKRNGVGLYTYSNGDQFEGEWKNGKKHGQGVMTFSNGAKYEGFYKDDLKAYRGRYTHADGSTYTGEYKHGKPSGRGVYLYPTGEKYEGEFAAGLKHGQGRVTLADGMCYNAKYHLGKRASRKKVVALPWGFGAEDEEEEEDQYSSARTAAKKESQRHRSTFAFLHPDAINKELPSSKPATALLEDDPTDRKKPLMIENGSAEDLKGKKRLSIEDGGKEIDTEEARDTDDEDLDIWEMTAHKMVKSKVAFDRSSVGRGPGTEDSHLVAKKGKHTLDGVASPSWAGRKEATEDGRDADARKMFDAIDADGSGTLDKEEVRAALMRFGFSNKKILALFEIADVDHDGTISFNEFRQGLVPLMAEADNLKRELRDVSRWEALNYIDVRLHRCRNLPPIQRDGEHGMALPFVQLTCGDQKKQSRTGKEGDTDPELDGQYTFYLNEGEDHGTLDVAVLDWSVESGQEGVIGGFSLPLARLLGQESIGRQWYTVHKDGHRVEHNGRPAQVELSFKSESLPAVCEVHIRTCDRLPINNDNKVDPYVKVTVAGQVRTSQVIKNSTRPEFYSTFNFNLFAEDLMSELVVSVIDWSMESKAGKRGGVIGQLKIQIHDLLVQNKSKDGWSTLMDQNNLPVSIGADGKAETKGNTQPPGAAASAALVPVSTFARINLRVRCRLRKTDAETNSERGVSRAGSPISAMMMKGWGGEEEASTQEEESGNETEDGDQDARKRMQNGDQFFSFMGSSQPSSFTHTSSSGPSSRFARAVPVSASSTRHQRGPVAGSVHSTVTHSGSPSQPVVTTSSSPNDTNETPPTNSGPSNSEGEEGRAAGGKALSRSEEVQLNKLRKKTAKALANGEQALAQQYRRDIARLLGQPMPQDPSPPSEGAGSQLGSYSSSAQSRTPSSYVSHGTGSEYTGTEEAGEGSTSGGSRSGRGVHWSDGDGRRGGMSSGTQSLSGTRSVAESRSGSAMESGSRNGLESGSRQGLESVVEEGSMAEEAAAGDKTEKKGRWGLFSSFKKGK